MIHAECLEPFRRWRVSAKAGGRRTSRSEMVAQANDEARSRRGGQMFIPQGAQTPIEIDLEIEAVMPLWALGYQDGATAEQQGLRGYRTHHHQMMKTKGRIAIDGVVTEVSGPTWRDHSRGPRTLTRWGSHSLLGVWFPESGRCLGLIRQVDWEGRETLNHAYVYEDGILKDATVLEMTPMGDVEIRRPKVDIVIKPKTGEAVRLTGQLIAETLAPIGSASWISEAQARWVLDGETSYGLCERSGDAASVKQPA